jgi:hypothetical protein
VAPEVAGSNPVIHPNSEWLRKLHRTGGRAHGLLTVQESAERSSCLALRIGQGVCVRIEGDLHARMAQAFRDHMRRLASLEQ